MATKREAKPTLSVKFIPDPDATAYLVLPTGWRVLDDVYGLEIRSLQSAEYQRAFRAALDDRSADWRN